MKLLNIPILSFENIYQHLEFIDVVNLASLSNRMQLRILSVKSSYKQGIECDIEIKKTRRVITLRKEGKMEFTWGSYTRRDDWAADAIDLVDKRFWGRVCRVSSQESGYRMIGLNEDYTLFWLHHLRALFDCQIDNLIYEKGNNPLVFDDLFVKSDALQVAGDVKLNALSLSHQQITHLFDNLKAKNLELCMDRTSSYEYRRCAYQFDSILISDDLSINVDDVWVMGQSCASVQLHSVEFPSWELNKLINDWLDSDNQKFEYCMIESFYYGHCPIDFDAKAIPATRGCPKRADASRFYDNTVRYEDGRDIRRRDGKLATMMMNRNIFTFIVWQMANPNL